MKSLLEKEFLDQLYSKLKLQNYQNGLYVVATPIGNLFDISMRALHIFEIADAVFAEDTRVTAKLLNFFKIKKKIISCNQHNELKEEILNMLKGGGVFALVCDAGTPLISDPGAKLINWCVKNSINVIAIPGASSILAAISVANLNGENEKKNDECDDKLSKKLNDFNNDNLSNDYENNNCCEKNTNKCAKFLNGKFYFYGFLDRKKKISELENLKKITVPIIFFESAQRILHTLNCIKKTFGFIKIYIGRELTKLHEENIRGNVDDVIAIFENMPEKLKGEFVIIIQQNCENNLENNEQNNNQVSPENESEKLENTNKITQYITQNILQNSAKDLSLYLSQNFHISKKNAYNMIIKMKK